MKKARFNILDGIIVLLVICAVAFAGYRLVFKKAPIIEGSKNITMKYQMEFKRKNPAFKDAISVNDRVYISAKERDEGVVVDVTSTPATRIELDRVAKHYRLTEIPNHYDVVVTIQSPAVETATEIKNGSTPIRVGAECVIRGKGYAAEGYIIDAEIVE